MLAGVERWKQTEQWQKEGGQFIPYPATFLNQRRWEDEPAGEHSPESSVGRGPQPPGEVQPLPTEAQKKLDEKHRLEEISRLEAIIKAREFAPKIINQCREKLEKLKPKPPVNP
jgi:hypothetical protein